jgi:hypothetical protein
MLVKSKEDAWLNALAYLAERSAAGKPRFQLFNRMRRCKESGFSTTIFANTLLQLQIRSMASLMLLNTANPRC